MEFRKFLSLSKLLETAGAEREKVEIKVQGKMMGTKNEVWGLKRIIDQGLDQENTMGSKDLKT